jgi:alcohol dehydrogenase class IV
VETRSFEFHVPVKLIFGLGVSGQLGEHAKQLGMRKVLIVTDVGIRESGILEKMEGNLKSHDVEVGVFDGVLLNPGSDVVVKGKQAYLDAACDGLVAVGGGACLDSAKAIGAMVTNEGRIEDYDFGRKVVPNPIPPLVNVTTTAGTGSEINMWSVITDAERRVKMSVGSPAMAPRLAFADPELTVTKPPQLTAASGMDALAHAVESYTSVVASPVTEPLALESIQVICRNLSKAVANGKDMTARYNMSLGSILAGMAEGNTGCINAHGIGAVLGGYYNASHGVLNAILLPYVMEFNMIAVPEKTADMAVAMGENTDGLSLADAGQKAIDAAKRLASDIGIPKGLREVVKGMKREDIPKVAEVAAQDMNCLNNPRINRVDDLVQIMEKAW